MQKIGLVYCLLPALLFSHSAAAQNGNWNLNGGLTLVHLDALGSPVEDDQTLSADLFLSRESQSGNLFIYVEGNSSLSSDNVSTVFIESNADAGSARDADRKGRVQISEFNYRFNDVLSGNLTTGLIDASAYLDRSRITNDENIQFLGASFVNNPTIEFPDYTLGFAYEKAASENSPGLNIVISSARGLADNPNLSYSQLVQLTDNNDGVFAAAGMAWESEHRLIRLGAWINTQPHVDLQNPANEDLDNYGMYTVLGYNWDYHAISFRAGMARESVSEGARFLSVAYRFLWRDFAIGLGVARTFLSADSTLPSAGDNTQYEIYARRSINDRIHLTASWQRINNSGFNNAPGSVLDEVSIAGLRAHLSF